MKDKRNKSGMQLSGSDWLENHHNAKKNLRYLFAKKIAQQNPKSIVDIGCGTGLWLSVFNDVLPKTCKFTGIDLDEESLREASERSKSWNRDCEWIKLDINKNPEQIPSADLTLIFNFSSYVENIDNLFSYLTYERGFKTIALRQFLGDEIKFGPFTIEEQTKIDLSVKDSIGNSNQIRYFDLSRLMKSVNNTNRKILFQDFEMFRAFSPFSSEVLPYIKGTAEWTAERMPNKDQKIIKQWITDVESKNNSQYFFSIDWISLLN